MRESLPTMLHSEQNFNYLELDISAAAWLLMDQSQSNRMHYTACGAAQKQHKRNTSKLLQPESPAATAMVVEQ
jgi:hypothetical protein